MKRVVVMILVLCLLLCVPAQAETLTTNGGVTLETNQLPHCSDDEKAPVVWFISDISAESLVRIYQALQVELPGKVGVKMSTGESTRSNYLRPELIADLVKPILAEKGISLILITLGPDGAFYRFKDQCGKVSGVPCVVADTNGAGDTFFGSFLSRLVKRQTEGSLLDGLETKELEGMIAFANKAASITTSRHGAIPAMPTMAEME